MQWKCKVKYLHLHICNYTKEAIYAKSHTFQIKKDFNYGHGNRLKTTPPQGVCKRHGYFMNELIIKRCDLGQNLSLAYFTALFTFPPYFADHFFFKKKLKRLGWPLSCVIRTRTHAHTPSFQQKCTPWPNRGAPRRSPAGGPRPSGQSRLRCTDLAQRVRLEA